MLIHLNNKAVLEIIDDMPTSIGWIGYTPTKKQWLETREEVEQLLGYRIADWGAFMNPSTHTFWTEIGNVCYCKCGEPALIEILGE
jgi:hypothetical protein